jgi:hypothetical protein
MRRRLRKERVANIAPAIRDELERAGEAVIANALAVPMDVPSSPFHKFRFGEERQAAEAWLIERRDIAERKEQRGERWVGIGALAAIVAAGAAVLLLVWQNERWNSEDRPQVVASYLEIENRGGPDYKYDWTFINIGKDDATNLKIKIATVDLAHTRHTPLTPTLGVLPRLKRGYPYHVTTKAQNDLEFLVVCTTYNNDSNTSFVDEPTFYFTSYYKQANHEARSQPSPVPAETDGKLSSGFSCAKLN